MKDFLPGGGIVSGLNAEASWFALPSRFFATIGKSKMFGKSDNTRIDDTTTFIANAAVLTPPLRNDIVNMVTTRFPRVHPNDRQAFHQLSSGMSVKSSIAVKADRGNSNERETRRAIFLLWKVIGKTLNNPMSVDGRANAAMTMLTGQLPAAFADVMFKAACVSSGAGAQHVFNELCTHPAAFLRSYRIMVFGSTAGRDKFTAAGGNYQNFFDFEFSYHAEHDRFEFNHFLPPGLGASHPVSAVSVPAVHWSDVPGVGPAPGNFSGVLGCEVTGRPIMLTTQFTGCSFCLTLHNGMYRAAHLSPAGDPNKVDYSPGVHASGGLALATKLISPLAPAAAMANAPGAAFHVFGNGAGNMPVPGGPPLFYPPKVQNATAGQMKYVTILGLDKGGNGWRFYTQAIDGANAIMPNEARRIL